ncbi:hypothetical protein Kfla_3123 [Kribbella flavida DSM 17836]|uniref:Uncharacterized protein n=1 Tax=Kribbella flavida (strain DSM 17836 / JCM 10339 / NBRC 14399) TaxID=479435 RepID=D2Q362_KRIFD|nr:hypothetical protein [Kribbella flavida]ADB32187.1 hypothetical protein Kfla_3123 [Kribbella flavida DSM 17836]
MTHQTFDLVRRLDPAADDALGDVTPASRAELLAGILDSPVDVVAARRSRHPVRRLAPVLVAASLLGGVVVSTSGWPGGTREQALGPALSFSTEGEFLKVRILDPVADSRRYNEEFKAQGLDIELVLIPASPSQVGQADGQLYSGSNTRQRIRFESVPAGCVEAATYPCVPEFTIPKDYRGTARFGINRAAAPGEQYAATGALNGRDEPLEGIQWLNRPVGEISAILRQRGFSITYRWPTGRQNPNATPPPTWYVIEPSFARQNNLVELEVSPRPMK